MNDFVKLDKRIVKVGIEVRGQLKVYEGLAIKANGTKYASPTQNTCEIAIANLDRETRDWLLTECSPFNKNNTPKRMVLEVGRESTGTFKLFEGDFAYCTLGQKSDVKEEKPAKAGAKPEKPKADAAGSGGDVSVSGGEAEMDIWVSFKALTLDSKKGKIVSETGLPVESLQDKAAKVAKSLGVNLNWSATNKNLTNTSFTGAQLQQVDDLGDAGGVSAFIDDGELVVKDINLPLPNFKRILNIDSGMVGKPEFTEQGCKVKFMIDPQTRLGGALEIISTSTPALSGEYQIYKLSFEVASRDVPFYYMAECKRI
jgi:hypothetical protein